MNLSRHILQIKSLIASPLIAQYLVGITANPVARRRRYFQDGFDCFFILDMALDKPKALSMELELFDALINDPRTYRKYHAEKRDGTHRPSVGGRDAASYVVYIVAFAPRRSPIAS